MRKIGKVLLWLLAALVVVVGGYAAYVFADYYRLEDNLSLPVENAPSETARTGRSYTLAAWNLGFGAYSADYSFFMDGGTESRALSRDAVFSNFGNALTLLRGMAPDFCFLEEIDTDSTRSYHVDESALAAAALPEYGRVFAQNYDSPYLFYPLLRPHGASRSGLMTFSRYEISSSVRRSLPVETGVWKLLDLDRCYSVTRVPLENGAELCLYAVHLSAYTSDGTIADEQIKMLAADMLSEYEKGNYAVCGGDFNKDLLGDSGAIFGVSGTDFTWAQPFPAELLPDGLTLVAPFDPAEPVPSCRNADAAYEKGVSFVLTVDGFLVSDNVTVLSSAVVDTGFAWSDHNPVSLTFSLD